MRRLTFLAGTSRARTLSWTVLALMGPAAFFGEQIEMTGIYYIAAYVTLAAIIVIRFGLRNSPYLLFLCLYSAVIGFASLLGQMPHGWTRTFSEWTALRQMVFIPIMALTIPIVAAWWLEESHGEKRKIITWILSLAVAGGIVFSPYISNVDDGSRLYGLFFLNTLKNNVLLFYVSLGLLVLFHRNKLAQYGLLVFLSVLCLAWSSYSQTQKFILLYTLLMAAPVIQRAAWQTIFALIICFPFVLYFVDMTPYVSDPNTLWRMTFWKDAIQSTLDTWGLGVGFGTEAIRLENFTVGNFYGGEDTYYSRDISFIGTHNGFMDILFRLGIVGFGTIFLFFISLVPPIKSRDAPLRERVVLASLLLAILAASVNVGFQSPTYVIGIVFVAGIAFGEQRRRTAPGSSSTHQVPARPVRTAFNWRLTGNGSQ